MARKYRYLITSGPRHHRSVVLKITTSCFQLLVVLVLGLIIGFNSRDVILRDCTLKVEHQPKLGDKTTREFVGNVNISSKDHCFNLTGNSLKKCKSAKKIQLVFKELPEKYRKLIPTHRPAAIYPLLPWKYLQSLDSLKKKLFMTFFIKTACHLVERRFLIRQTWGSIASINKQNFGIIFLVGLAKEKEQQELLIEENQIYGDILQSDVVDDYFHLPQKVLAGFQWVTYELGDVSEFYVTTDDDCSINMPTVFDYFYPNKELMLNKIHCGYIFDKGHGPIRKKKSKWTVSLDVYPDNVYPTFCHGGMTVWSYKIIKDIYLTSETTNYTGMHLEDVLISGILRHKTYNSSDNLFPKGFQGIRGKNRRPEPFVYHLGLSKHLRRSFALRWFDIKAGLRVGKEDRMVGKQASAFVYKATIAKLSVPPGGSINATIKHFISSWAKYSRKPATSAPTRNQSDVNTNLKDQLVNQQITRDSDIGSRPTRDSDVIDKRSGGSSIVGSLVNDNDQRWAKLLSKVTELQLPILKSN